MDRKTATKIYALLLKGYPDSLSPPCSRGTPFEVLILTILSAQTTDQAVLRVKMPLFLKYPDPAALAKADPVDVEEVIHSLGFYHAKARHIIAASQKLIAVFNGIVPETMDELLTIPGVGRKTANIVLYHAHGKNHGIAVDTHVRRLAQRIGFSDTGNVDRIEKDLMGVIPQKQWGDLTDILIAHGRACCTAKKPGCERCPVSRFCRYFRTMSKNQD
jgi:endonuclease-3